MKLTQQQFLRHLYELKREIQMADFPPNYFSDIKFYKDAAIKNEKRESGYIGLNCYAYALQFKKMVLDCGSRWYCPGFLSDRIPYDGYNKENLIDAVINDLLYLGLDYRETSIFGKANFNAYKIGILLGEEDKEKEEKPDFHFARTNQVVKNNQDNLWSHMKGRNGEIEIIDDPSKIEGYQLIKVLEISKKSGIIV